MNVRASSMETRRLKQGRPGRDSTALARRAGGTYVDCTGAFPPARSKETFHARQKHP